MAKPLVSDELWAAIEPLLPPHRAAPGKRGRPPLGDRAALTGILFVLKSGIPWEMLPQEMGCGSGMRLYWGDLLATLARLAWGGRLAEAARGPARAARGGPPD